MNKNSSKKKRKIQYVIVLFIILFIVPIFFIFAKYKSDTPHKIIQLFTKYNVNYQTNSGKIKEPEKFNSYYSRNGLKLPVEGDITRVGHDFAGWYLNNNFTGASVTEIEKGDWGDKLFFAAWNTAEYNLKVQTKDLNGNIVAGLPDNYDIVIGKDNNGNDNVVQEDSSGIIKKVGKYQQVAIRIPYSAEASSSELSFNDESISLDMRYTDGDQYIYFVFDMPKKDLTITYNMNNDLNNYIDISKSSIIFEENVKIKDSSITVDGFWYKSTINGMVRLGEDENKGYFYEWDYSKPFYVTSKNKETQNQLVLVDAMTIYFKDCILVATDSYSKDVVGTTIKGIEMYRKNTGAATTIEKLFTNSDWRMYGNIILDNSIHSNYATKIYLDGENTIGSIFQSQYYGTTTYISNLYIEGINNAKLQLGSIYGNLRLNIKDSIIISEYDNNKYVNNPDNSSFLFWLYNPNYQDSYFYNDINCSNKILYYGSGNIYICGKVDIREICMGLTLTLSDNANVHVYENVISNLGNYSQAGNSSILIDGNLLLSGYEQSTVRVNTTGYLIVKGNRAQLHKLYLTKGTIISNIINLSSMASLSGGTIITNQITNYVVSTPVTDMDTSNGDDSEYITYSSKTLTYSNIYEFSGSQIYLLGYYQKNGDYYDTTFTTNADGNPIGRIINKYFEGGPSILNNDYLENTMKENITDKECIILGNTNYTDKYNYGRKVKITGGQIKAAGNITFFNDTSVSRNVIIDVAGTFGSKRNLTISGGRITAKEVGNAYDVYNTAADGNNYWQKTLITGGIINTDRIGSLSTSINSHISRSTVNISGDTSIKPLTDANVTLVTDVYVNYVYNNHYTNSPSNVNNIRFKAVSNSINNSSSLTKIRINDDLSTTGDFSLVDPIYNDSDVTASWALDNLMEYCVDTISSNGDILNEADIVGNTFIQNDDFREYVSLYAFKNQNQLIIKEGLAIIDTLTDESNASVGIDSDILKLNSDSKYTLKLKNDNYDMASKSVIWYYDANNVLHGADTVQNAEDGTIQFVMPRADTEVYITNELKLYLNLYSISFTNTGFSIEEKSSSRRKDSIFNYIGDIYITNSNITSTTFSGFNYSGNCIKDQNNSYGNNRVANKIIFEDNSGNGENSTFKRNITIGNLIQYNPYAETNSIGNNNDVIIGIDGSVELGVTNLNSTSSLKLYGKNGKSVDNLYMRKSEGTAQYIIGSNTEKAGNLTFQNLHFISNRGHIASSISSYSNTFTMDNCIIELSKGYQNYLAYGYNDIVINNSSILRNNDHSQSNQGIFAVANNVTLNNSEVKYEDGDKSAGAGSTFFRGIKDLTLNDSQLELTYIRSTDSTSRFTATIPHGEARKIILNGNSNITSEIRLILNNLILNDNSSVIVENTLNEKDGYILCPDIEVNDYAQIKAGLIVVSGYYSTSTPNYASDIIKYLNNNTSILDGSTHKGIVINDNANVIATKSIGGNVYSKVIVNGNGTLTANRIGATGKLYGATAYIPKNSIDDIVSIDNNSVGATVTINGGTVNVSDDGYLGGMNAKIDINGGIINLGENAIIGINEQDTTTLVNSITSLGNTPSELVDVNIHGGTITGSNGYIHTPYSTLSIDSTSSNPSIKLKDVLAEQGTVYIGSTANHYDNPLGEGKRVGTIINNNLIAQNIEINNGSVVYAKNAIIKNNKATAMSYFKVGSTSYLYSSIYGTDGVKNFTLENKGTIVGTRQYSIIYNMKDTFIDQATNLNDYHYVEGLGVQLVAPTRFGYIFKGWYDTDGNKITEISKTEVGDKELLAHWEAKAVEFVITTSASEAGLSIDEFKNQFDPSLGEFNELGDKFTYKEHLYISYHELLNTKLLLSNYNLPSSFASSAKINNDQLNPEGDILNLTSTGDTVTKEMMEYFSNNNIPIEISVCEYA